MAVFRKAIQCPKCGESLTGIYQDRGNDFIGDTFVKWDYEAHNKICKDGVCLIETIEKSNVKLPINYPLLRDMANDYKVNQINIIGVVFSHIKQDLKDNSLKSHEHYFQMLSRLNKGPYYTTYIQRLFAALVYFQTQQFWSTDSEKLDINQGEILRKKAPDSETYEHLICMIGTNFNQESLFYNEATNKLVKRVVSKVNDYEILKPIKI